MARSALGREINMSALASRNEKVRAVGNMRVNARGDLLDSNNNVITNANKRVESSYNQSVVDDNMGLKPTVASSTPQNNQMHNPGLTIDKTQIELTPEEQELFDDVDDEEIEK